MANAAPHSRDLPLEFSRHNHVAPTWLRALPDLLDRLAERWSLTLGAPFPKIAINYVAPATRADGTPCVLKVSRHVSETRNEIAALRLWDGHGAARLLEADPDSGALLVERLEPGTMLVEMAESDDDVATVIAAGILRQLWQPALERPVLHGLRPLESWCDAYDRNRAALSRGAGGFPAALFQRADALRRNLLASTGAPAVLHGDLHHFNVLNAQRAEWLAIDPKGLAGDRCFDVCQFLRNPHAVPPSVNGRRLGIFCAELGLDRRRTRDWCLVHAVLNACWDFEDGNPWQRAVAYAEDTLSF
ncbi:MAG: phosphotransferase [Chloroflexi bacterium]|nr:phosphotransferase [Chloroflexota bacterium]